MKRTIFIVLLICLMTAAMSACESSRAGNESSQKTESSRAENESSQKTESSAKSCPEKIGLFSGAGGWKADVGIILLLEADGSGAMMNDASHGINTSNLNRLNVSKTDITWEEDEKTVRMKDEKGEYVFQKSKNGDNDSLDLSGIIYTRLSEDELKEYQEKAAAGNAYSGAQTETVASASRNEEIALEEPIVIIDNDKVTVKIIRFFREVYNEGTDHEFTSAGFEIEAENKTESYEIILAPRDCSLADRRVIEFASSGNNRVAPGKIAVMKFIKGDNSDFDPLDSLYELEGNLDMTVRDDHYSYSDLGGKLAFSIPDAVKDKEIAAEAGKNREEYRDVFTAVSANVWVFNGGSDTILNVIAFKQNKAAIGQVYFDGNGFHDNGVKEYAYIISDENITVTIDEGELTIPYTMSGKEVTLGNGDYFSLEQVEEGLQGYWECKKKSVINKGVEDHLLVDHGTLRSEGAAEALGGEPGEYYYFGPEEGTYTLGIGKFKTTMRHGDEWFYNIIDGKPTILHYDTVCVPGDGFPGRYGYYF